MTLPPLWEQDQLGLFKWASGGTPSRGDPSFFGGDIPWLLIGDLTDSEIQQHSETLTARGLENSSAKWVEPDSVLVAMYGSIGKLGITKYRLATNQAIAFASTDPMPSRFIFYYLLRMRGELLALGKGGTQSNINQSVLRAFPLIVPPLAEQHRIVARLDELFSELDAGVAALERVRRKLPRYRAALLHAAVTGELTRDWRAAHPAADGEDADALLREVLDARRADWERRTREKYEADGKKPPKGWQQRYRSGAAPDPEGLTDLPAGWCWATLDQVGDVTGGVARNKKDEIKTDRVEVPFLSVANVQRGRLDLDTVKTVRVKQSVFEALLLRKGDILLTEGGDRNKLGRGWVWDEQIDPCIHQNHIFRCRLVDDRFEPELISHAGNSYGRQWFLNHGKQSVNLASISLGVLRTFPVPVAPLAEQAEIRERMVEKLSQIDAMQAEITRGLRRAERLRQSILKAAFEGRLVPQDPADEPASVLLARIAADRAAS